MVFNQAATCSFNFGGQSLLQKIQTFLQGNIYLPILISSIPILILLPILDAMEFNPYGSHTNDILILKPYILFF